MNQTYTGRAKLRTDVMEASGGLPAAGGRIGNGTEEYGALLDTASQWCVLPPGVAFALGYAPVMAGDTRLHTRFGVLSGELIRLSVQFATEEGEPAEVKATWFLSPEWPGPVVIGWKGCLERMRFAFDPHESDFYFAEY